MSDMLISVLLAFIPVSLALSSWYIGTQKRANNGKGAFRLISLLGFIFAATAVLYSQFDATPLSVLTLSPARLIVLGLILFMSLILIKFCRNYMAGEQRINLFWRRLIATLSAVSLVVISNHLVLFWLGWVAISLALHRLLMFYPDRPRAVMAAHKKFIVARCAETSLLVAFALLYWHHDSLLINEITASYVNNTVPLTLTEHCAGFFIALAALIKCAQLPIHGWLMQVVEAPTPVSALLHAGVINLGGFLLIIFAPLFMQATVGQWLVLIVAGLTTVISALVMTTRVSVKVRLAWSTSAQMGLMLVECALGLFELALLHLVTHSAYKAHAFLNSGSAVQEDIARRLSPGRSPNGKDWLASGVFSCIAVALVYHFSGYYGAISVWALVALALSVLIATRRGLITNGHFVTMALLALALASCYAALKSLFAVAVPASNWREAPLSAADLWTLLLIVSLMCCSYVLRYQNHKPRVQALSAILFAGLYLDEWLTRLTLRIWPTRLPTRQNAKTASHSSASSAKENF